MRHTARMTAASLVIVACMFLPFLPGGSDGLAPTLSGMAQTFGMAGLLLVPIGAAWLGYELRTRAAHAAAPRGRDAGWWFALAAIVAATLVALVVSVPALAEIGPSLGLALLAAWAYWALRFTARLNTIHGFNPAPIYLIGLPVLAVILKLTLLGPAAERSRDRAIENSATLIGDIERYRDTHGAYPRSLLSVWNDYKLGAIGVVRYHYEPNGDAYNLFFEHPSVRFGTREIVMYNKLDEHEMTSHDMDLLTRMRTELSLRRGYYAVNNTARPHWKYFWFD